MKKAAMILVVVLVMSTIGGMAEGQPSAAGIPQAYVERAASYAAALSEGWDPELLMENGMSLMMVDCYGDAALENIGYAVADMDGNGVPELVIGATEQVADDFYSKIIFDLYTLDADGLCQSLFSSAHRSRIYYAGGNCFAYLGSSGASDSVDTTLSYGDGVFRLFPY